ncbi:helix-turn-helix domain-containing protein [Mycolicibacterium goodii]|uniref:helix-turn-helix domain-containing protein n=1 Tax=Mycolicibacterium goodii TaxID=134601 RepID=UPI001F0397D0|nr:helix-turn-helix domain-containing protein [Mycolicibacterium goodii]ULN47975.1 helix-turn-helix domain-containing protein [Mycolicibacterium goodii]
MTIAPQLGVFVSLDDARRLLALIDSASRVARPSAAAADVARRLRQSVESCAKLSPAQENPQSAVHSGVGPIHSGRHDHLTAAEAARILGCTPANLRDLRRRGVLAGQQVGREWLYRADEVHARAERRSGHRPS